MGTIDLSTATGFARATNSFGASILSAFTGSGPSAWVLEEGTYQSGINPANQVVFHVFRSQQSYNGALDRIGDRGGRRKAKFEFPFLDGQLTEDMGRKAESFELNIILFGGTYYTAFTRLMAILNEPTPGTLIHPVRGKITCSMEDYEIVHEERSRNAIGIRLTMIEHSTSGLALQTRKDSSAPSKLSALTATFTNVANAIANVQGAINFAQSLKNTIIQGYQSMQQAYAALAANMNSTFNAGGNIPALLPTQVGGLLNTTTGTTQSNSTSIALSPADPFVNLPSNLTNTTLEQALAISQLENDVQTVRDQIAAQISLVEGANGGAGSLLFFSDIINLRQAANALQDAFEAGKQSSQVKIISYTTPYMMSVREAAFLNGLTPDDGVQIAYLNPQLDSLNSIPKGTQLTIAVST